MKKNPAKGHAPPFISPSPLFTIFTPLDKGGGVVYSMGILAIDGANKNTAEIKNRQSYVEERALLGNSALFSLGMI